ncbi:MAG: hydroxyacid dehydrogenase [Opitutaceae bacterium]|nr:hydroxyacid dehydrogenase [Opitutaceae bacterium]
MSSLTSLLAVLNPAEQAHFYPGAQFDELRALAPQFRLLDPSGVTPEEFARLLEADTPDAILSCWHTPRLPAAPPPRLRYLCHTTGSVRHLVTRAHIEHGLLVTNWGSSISRTIAECALHHILACLRRTTQWTFVMHQEGGWRGEHAPIASLFGRRVGIHGYGAIAREFLKLIAPFDCKVSVFAPDFDAAAAERTGAQAAPSLDALFADNDVIVELAPLNPVTRGCVTEHHFKLIRPGGVFVNVARAGITDEAALLRLVKEGRIFAGLDVFADEPLPPDHGFRGLRNVSLTPHIAGPTVDRYPDAGAHAIRNLRAFAAGQPLSALYTPDSYDQAS